MPQATVNEAFGQRRIERQRRTLEPGPLDARDSEIGFEMRSKKPMLGFEMRSNHVVQMAPIAPFLIVQSANVFRSDVLCWAEPPGKLSTNL